MLRRRSITADLADYAFGGVVVSAGFSPGADVDPAADSGEITLDGAEAAAAFAAAAFAAASAAAFFFASAAAAASARFLSTATASTGWIL